MAGVDPDLGLGDLLLAEGGDVAGAGLVGRERLLHGGERRVDGLADLSGLEEERGWEGGRDKNGTGGDGEDDGQRTELRGGVWRGGVAAAGSRAGESRPADRRL